MTTLQDLHSKLQGEYPEYNIIDGEVCCWRCGLPRKEARFHGGCYTGYGSYSSHMYKATNLLETIDTN